MQKKHLTKFNILHGESSQKKQEVGIEGNFLKLTKNINKIPTANILNGKRLNAFTLR